MEKKPSTKQARYWWWCVAGAGLAWHWWIGKCVSQHYFSLYSGLVLGRGGNDEAEWFSPCPKIGGDDDGDDNGGDDDDTTATEP